MGQNKKSIANRATEGVRTTSVGGSTAVTSEVLLILTDIDVSAPLSMVAGNQAQATALGYMRGNTVPGITDDVTVPVTAFTWASSNANVATVNATGVISAVASGSVTITAVAQGTTSPVGSAQVTVVTPTPAIASIAVTPSNVSLNVSATQQFVATATYTDQTQGTPTPLVWDFSSGTTYASINSVTGVVTGVASFNTVIVRATSGNTAGTVQMAVYSSATTSQGYVPAVSDNFANYADTDTVLAAYNGTSSPPKNLVGYNNGYQGVWETNMGRTSSWRTEAFQLVSDPVFTKAVRMGQWGRNEYTHSINTAGSGPTGKLRYDLPSTLSVYWSSRYIRLQDASESPSGALANGWSARNDGSSYAYKIIADGFTGSSAPNGLQFRMVINSTSLWATDWHNHASYTESNLTTVRQSGTGNTLAAMDVHQSDTNSNTGWWHIINYYQRKSSTEYNIGFWIRRAYTRQGAALGIAPYDAASGSTIHQWYCRVCRYTRASGTIVAPLGINVATNGENMNSTISRSQFVFWQPIEVVDGSQYPDPYGLLALFSITP